MLRDIADVYRGVFDDPRQLREPAVAILCALPVVALVVLWIIYAAIQNDRRQAKLIQSGACEAVQEALYTPPGHMQCMAYNDKGVCTFQQWVQPSPYMRTLWQCPDESFWRRSGR